MLRSSPYYGDDTFAKPTNLDKRRLIVNHSYAAAKSNAGCAPQRHARVAKKATGAGDVAEERVGESGTQAVTAMAEGNGSEQIRRSRLMLLLCLKTAPILDGTDRPILNWPPMA